MWLLNAARAELKFFPTPESVPGGYAILSHVWDEHEQTFQDLQLPSPSHPRGGHEWGWADMCCIDKTSSTELSEAIVSMYRYYSLADVCYAYLRDVPTASKDELRAPEFAFRESGWYKRGWTLQELIAPAFMVFVSQTWEVLGAKADLEDVLEDVTRDEAYCLMRIFGIFMPPLYGEGRNAFLWLQKRIMRQIDDPSIFTWGRIRSGNRTLKFHSMAEHTGSADGESIPGRTLSEDISTSFYRH
ncbi:hypothetical protein V8D89_002504 [Ganoderma adspersum]